MDYYSDSYSSFVLLAERLITSKKAPRVSGAFFTLEALETWTRYGLKRQIFCNTASKCSLIHKGLPALFPCLPKKFALFKLSDLYIRKIFVFLVRKGEARLSPCETDKPKKRKFNNREAYYVQVPNAFISLRFSKILSSVRFSEP